ncbi:MAG: HAD hydrolase-like protein [Patescibacteria group bacterium]|nr:HAD hydrolase-like protein [Patescibacteria group bacterium]
MKIPLFDLDGTLLKQGNKIHNEAFDFAFKTVYRTDVSKREIKTHGMIDTQIIIEVLKLNRINKEVAKSKMDQAIKVMVKYLLEHAQEEEYSTLLGVEKTLVELKKNKIPLGLLTGNIEGIAWKKLENAGIKDYFDFGAFGDSAFKRVSLVEIARKNAKKKFNKNFSKYDFVIVGDTPKDITCAKDAGIESIGVATGVYSKEELEKSGADLVIKNLEETEKILKFLEN